MIKYSLVTSTSILTKSGLNFCFFLKTCREAGWRLTGFTSVP
jgi:hypothetical protein